MIHPVSNFIVSYFYWVFLGVLVVNLMQRRRRAEAQRKRSATLYLAIFVFVFYIYAYGIIQLNLPEWFLLLYVALVAALMWFYRRTFLPFTLKCRSCATTLSFDRILYADSNLCLECAEREDARLAGGRPVAEGDDSAADGE